MRPIAYTSPTSIEDALSALADAPATTTGLDETMKPLAGGTDLLTLIKADLATPDTLIDIKRLVELDDEIEPDGEGVRIGALVTLAQIENDPILLRSYPALAQSARLAATPQLRNMATIGGNLLQRPRCWYFRDKDVHCWLKGGTECFARHGENQYHAIFGESPCIAVHPSDPAGALFALGAEVRIRGANGERTLPVERLFAEPTDERRREHTLDPHDIIIGIHLPPVPDGGSSAYVKAMERKVWAFAVVGAAASVNIEGGQIREASVVLTGVAPTPWRARAAEAILIGQPPSEDLFARAADAALVGAHPQAHNGYKVPLAKSLIRRALQQATAGVQ